MHKGFVSTFLLAGIIIIGVLLAGSFYLGIRHILNPLSLQNQQISAKQGSQNSEFQLLGSEVVKVENGQKSVLFKNVRNVGEIRLGPDGKTLHFKVNNLNSQEAQNFCVDLESNLGSVLRGWPSPSQLLAPFDYQSIEDYGTTHHCYTYYNRKAGGYLKNSDYFVYLKLTSPVEGQLYYKYLKTGEVKEASVKSELLSVLKDKVNYPDVIAQVGKDGYEYFYPYLDSYLQDNYLIIAIRPLIIAVDMQKNSIVGVVKAQNAGVFKFQFHFQKWLPFVVVENIPLDTLSSFGEIIDVSFGNFKTINLKELDDRSKSYLGFKNDPIVWEPNSMLLNFNHVEDATEKLPSIFASSNWPSNESAKQEAERNKTAEQFLKNKYGYLEVRCSLTPGVFGGCEGLRSKDYYRYSTNEGVLKKSQL